MVPSMRNQNRETIIFADLGSFIVQYIYCQAPNNTELSLADDKSSQFTNPNTLKRHGASAFLMKKVQEVSFILRFCMICFSEISNFSKLFSYMYLYIVQAPEDRLVLFLRPLLMKVSTSPSYVPGFSPAACCCSLIKVFPSRVFMLLSFFLRPKDRKIHHLTKLWQDEVKSKGQCATSASGLCWPTLNYGEVARPHQAVGTLHWRAHRRPPRTWRRRPPSLSRPRAAAAARRKTLKSLVSQQSAVVMHVDGGFCGTAAVCVQY